MSYHEEGKLTPRGSRLHDLLCEVGAVHKRTSRGHSARSTSATGGRAESAGEDKAGWRVPEAALVPKEDSGEKVQQGLCKCGVVDSGAGSENNKRGRRRCRMHLTATHAVEVSHAALSAPAG